MPKSNKGFTLLEMLVALAIFIVVSMVAVSIFLVSIKNQRHGFQVQELQENARYIMETMVKEIRMSQAISTPRKPTAQTGDKVSSLTIINQSDEEITYNFDNDKITRAGKEISSSKIKLEGNFNVINRNNFQPRVTIKMRVWPSNAATPEINVQNTVALRAYEE